MQAVLVDTRTQKRIAILTSHVRARTCWITAHVYESVMFRVYCSKERLKEVAQAENFNVVSRITHEPQWV